MNEKRNKEDISLASETLDYLGKVCAEGHLSELRSLAVNLCHFQERFSVPMELPFGMGTDFAEKLETPRPVDVLFKLGAIYKIPQETMEEICLKDTQGNFYCLAGGALWKKMVESKKLEGADSEEPKVSSFSWLKDLFSVFRREKKLDASRRLAACWYYTATQVDFDEKEDGIEEEVDPQKQTLEVAQQLSFLGEMFGMDDDEGEKGEREDLGKLLEVGEGYNSEEDGDFVPEEEGEEGEGERKKRMEEIFKVEEDYKSEEDEDFVPGGEEEEDEKIEEEGEEERDLERKKRMAKIFNIEEEYKSDEDEDFVPGGEEEGDMEDEDLEDEAKEEVSQENMQSIMQAVMGFQESGESKEIREHILQCIEELHAYLPSPETHMPFFKRMLAEATGGSPKWFPHGLPIQKIVDTIQQNDDEDEDMCTFLREILQPFAFLEGEDQGEDQE